MTYRQCAGSKNYMFNICTDIKWVQAYCMYNRFEFLLVFVDVVCHAHAVHPNSLQMFAISKNDHTILSGDLHKLSINAIFTAQCAICDNILYNFSEYLSAKIVYLDWLSGWLLFLQRSVTAKIH